jgi:hypothetical protein
MGYLHRQIAIAGKPIGLHPGRLCLERLFPLVCGFGKAACENLDPASLGLGFDAVEVSPSADW